MQFLSYEIELDLQYNCQYGCPSASPHVNQAGQDLSNPLIMFGYEHPEHARRIRPIFDNHSFG